MALTVKALKSKLDGNELDLSMSDLIPTAVPVKELSVVTRATRLDLSVNRLTWLPDDFCSLTHLVSLDLSQNQLQDLPEKFGNLLHLEKLDLYKNCLSTLPISFCRLKKLKWLDLKDNPLTDDLRAVTGDCLDDKQCQKAAQQVVVYVQKVQSSQERERQKMLQKQKDQERVRKEAEEAATLKERQAKNKEKERKKQEKQKKHNMQNGAKKEGRFAERTGEVKATARHKANKAQRKSVLSIVLGCIHALVRILMYSSFFAGLIALAGGWILYSNCSSHPEWIPNSKPLCHDLYQWSTTGATPSVENLKLASAGFGKALKGGAENLLDRVVAVDYGVWATAVKNFVSRMVTMVTTTDYGKLAQDVSEWVSKSAAKTQEWTQKEAIPWTRRTAIFAWEEAKVGLRWTLDRTFEAAQWVSENAKNALSKIQGTSTENGAAKGG